MPPCAEGLSAQESRPDLGQPAPSFPNRQKAERPWKQPGFLLEIPVAVSVPGSPVSGLWVFRTELLCSPAEQAVSK